MLFGAVRLTFATVGETFGGRVWVSRGCVLLVKAVGTAATAIGTQSRELLWSVTSSTGTSLDTTSTTAPSTSALTKL